jgi:hypothetical protein
VKTTRRQFVFCVLGAPLLARGVEDVQHPLAEHAVLEEFDRRVKAYVALHDRLEATLPPFAPSNDMAVIERHAAAMARLLHASRGDARRGDLFAPDAEAVIRTRVAMALEGVDTYALLADLEEEHPGAVSLKPRVNASYPHGALSACMPIQLLQVLPPLEGDVAYRLMHRHLLLWDVHANLVIDYIENVVPMHRGEHGTQSARCPM